MEGSEGKKIIIDLNSEDNEGDTGWESGSTDNQNAFAWQQGDEVGVEEEEQWSDGEEDYIEDDVEVKEVMKMTFESEEHAYEFYNLYGKIKGFSIRKADVKHNEEGIARYRKFACSQEGKRHKRYIELQNRKREPKLESRTGCMACLRIKYEKVDMKYVVTDFVKDHNHKMESRECVAYLRSHRKINDADIAHAGTMRKSGAKICEIMKFFAMQCGGYANVGFVLKDLYNRMDVERRKYIEEGDAEAAIAYLTGRKATDESFYFDYAVDEDGRLRNIFWADAEARVDYECFGDVLVFDSTYKSNGYHKPLVVFTGVNNHFNTIIFGSALVCMERAEEYEWVLGTFAKAMGGKEPRLVVTDGDKAMRKAIKHVFPKSKHRLCTWHLNQNVDVKVKSKMFKSMFSKFMKKAYPVEDFEEDWYAVVLRCGLLGNKWVRKVFDNREVWAETLLRGYFFAGMRSTQRCEGMNAFLKRYLKETMRLFECVRMHELAVDHLRHTCTRAVHESEDTTVVLGTELRSLERHATTVYTRRVFFMVKKHLQRQGLYVCIHREQIGQAMKYLLTKYGDVRSWIVQYNAVTEELTCSCNKLVWKGLPCAHMFRVMVMENMKEIPGSCIVKRWTIKARESAPNVHVRGSEGLYDEQLQNARYGALVTSCRLLCFCVSHMADGFEHVSTVIASETGRWMREWIDRGLDQCGKDHTQFTGNEGVAFKVLDPVVTISKGDHVNAKKSKSIKCGKCESRDGHNKRTCRKNVTNPKEFRFGIVQQGMVDTGGEMESSCQQNDNNGCLQSSIGQSGGPYLQKWSGMFNGSQADTANQDE